MSNIRYNFRLIFFYFCGFCLLISGWTYLFFPKKEVSNNPLKNLSFYLTQEQQEFRHTLKQALLGDLMAIEQILKNWKTNKLLDNQTDCLTQNLLAKLHKKQKLKKKLVAQSFSAFALIWALAGPETLLFKPKNIETCAHLFDQNLNNIPSDLDLEGLDEMCLNQRPQVFLAPYSSPQIVQGVKRRGLPFYIIPHPKNIEAFFENILTIGKIIDENEKAQLMVLFIKETLKFLKLKKPVDAILAKYYYRLSFPEDPFFISLLNAINFPLEKPSLSPLEKIYMLNPSRLFISTPNPKALNDYFIQYGANQTLLAYKNKKIYLLDDNLVSFPSQHAILTLFDIISLL